MKPTERCFRFFYLVVTNRLIHIDSVATRLGVSRKTVMKYIQDIRPLVILHVREDGVIVRLVMRRDVNDPSHSIYNQEDYDLLE